MNSDDEIIVSGYYFANIDMVSYKFPPNLLNSCIIVLI